MPEWLAVTLLTALVFLITAAAIWLGRDSDANG